MNKSKSIAALSALYLVLACVSIANASLDKNYYVLKSAAPTGTKIQPIDARSVIPFDKRYFELSDSEKEIFRAKFENISSTEIPPFPRSGLKAIYKPLIEQFKNLSAHGSLSLKVRVDENGRVTDFTVLQSPTKRLTRASQKILQNTLFDPAFCEGEPCEMDFPVTIEYL
jgi:TonB family protein